jgi:hypothetical protein
MKRLWYLFVVSLVLLAFVGCSNDGNKINTGSNVSNVDNKEKDITEENEDKFVSYEDESGKFKISFPGTPIREYFPLSPEDDSEFLILYFQNDSQIYTLMYMDIDEEDIDIEEANELLDITIEEVLEEVDEVLSEVKEIKIGEHIGREVVYKMSEGTQELVIFHRYYIVGNGLYQLQFSNGETSEKVEEMDKFFDSFELVE